MKLHFQRLMDLALVLLLGLVTAIPQDVFAQNHVISSSDLERDVAAVSQARQSNLAQLDRFFSSEQAQKALKSAHIQYKEVQAAMSVLSDAELARLAAQSQKAQKDFAAGSLTNQQITYILIALATAVIVIILVEAR